MASPRRHLDVARSAATWREALVPVTLAFVASRLLIVAVGVAAIAWWGVDAEQVGANYQARRSAHAAVEMWLRFDASWYLEIAAHGYTGQLPSHYDMRPGFFPAYPALVHAVTRLVGNDVAAGLLVSNVACFVFLLATWVVAREDLGEAIATRGVWVIALWPGSFFLSGIYSEATMLAATALTLLAARRRRWWPAGIAAGVATLSRTIGGVALLPALDHAWSRNVTWRQRISATVALGVPVLMAVAVYAWIATASFGSPQGMLDLQQAYRGPTTWPWNAFVYWWQSGPAWHGYANSTLDALLAAGALSLSVVGALRWRPSYAVYAFVVILVPLTTSLVSFVRLTLAAFPCLVMLAALLDRRPLRVAWWVISTALLVVMTARFATWRWVA